MYHEEIGSGGCVPSSFDCIIVVEVLSCGVVMWIEVEMSERSTDPAIDLYVSRPDEVGSRRADGPEALFMW